MARSAADRDRRLAEALRENLRRRKQQAHGDAELPAGEAPGATPSPEQP